MSILMLIKTTGLEYDDRIRKECISLHSWGQMLKIVVLDSSNVRNRGMTEYNVLFESISLITRKILPNKRGLMFKTLEMYARFFLKILKKRPRVLWLHDMEMPGLVLVGWMLKKINLIERLVWDQHELPSENVLSNRITRNIFKVLLDACDAIVVANDERRSYLLSWIGKQYTERIHVLENLADQQFASLPRGILPETVAAWLRGKQYILAQGGAANPGRYFPELVEAVIRFGSIKLVVVGPYQEEMVRSLKSRWGDDRLDDHVYLTGMVPQREMVSFIDNTLASVILYTQKTVNSRLCAPNRLYQALSRGIPVIVGSNPPMANIVRRLGYGVVLSSDGRAPEDISNGIKQILAQYEAFKEKAQANRLRMTWESQERTISDIVGELSTESHL